MKKFLTLIFFCPLLQNVYAAGADEPDHPQTSKSHLGTLKPEQIQGSQSQRDQEICDIVRQYFDIPYTERPNPMSVGNSLFEKLSPKLVRKTSGGTTAPK